MQTKVHIKNTLYRNFSDYDDSYLYDLKNKKERKIKRKTKKQNSEDYSKSLSSKAQGRDVALLLFTATCS